MSGALSMLPLTPRTVGALFGLVERVQPSRLRRGARKTKNGGGCAART